MMNNNLQFTIEIVPKGIEQVNKLPAVVSTVNTAVEQMNSSFNSVGNVFSPFDKLMKVLTNIEKILLEIGKVSVESFNKLDDICVTNTDGFKKTKEHAEKLDKQIEQIGKTSNKAGSEFKKGLLDKLAEFGQAFIGFKAIAQTIAGSLGSVFGEGMSRQNAVSDFETLLYGDKEAAKKLAEDIRQTDAATLYGTDTMNEAVKQMIGYGVDTETSFQMSEALGNIAMGDKNKMGSLSMAFSQMAGLGKLQTQDWKQMVGAGFNPFNQMEKDLGKSKDELQEIKIKENDDKDKTFSNRIRTVKG